MKKTKPKIRRTWKINPKTRVKKSDKIYKRTKAKQQLKKIVKRTEDEENT